MKSDIQTSVARQEKYNNVVNFKAFQKKNLPYMLIWIVYYAWIIVYTTWWATSPLKEQVLSTGMRNIVYTINLISCAVFILILRKKWFVKISRIAGWLLVVGMGVILFTENSAIHAVLVPGVGILIGAFSIAILIPFVFALNNTEKFYSIIGSFILIYLLLLVQYYFSFNHVLEKMEHIVPLVILIFIAVITFFFKKSSISNNITQKETEVPELNPRVYLAMAFSCMVAILYEVSKGVLNNTADLISNTVNAWYYIGGIAGCFVYITVYAYSKKAFLWVSNITFGSIAMGLLCNAFIMEIPKMAAAFAFLLGIGSTVGMIHIFYMLTVVAKKYNSMRYLRLSIFFIGVCGGVSGVILGNLVNNSSNSKISFITSIITAALVLIFLMISPVFSSMQYYDTWAKDSEKMEIANEVMDIFGQYHLTKREKEVCKLLLDGYTLRQISAILSIAYPTVNTYCTSAYRKLKINSRMELLLLFKDYMK